MSSFWTEDLGALDSGMRQQD